MKKIKILFLSLLAVIGFTPAAKALTKISPDVFTLCDSYEEEYDDTYDEDNADTPAPKARSRWEKTSGYFTININNAIAGAQTVELFNSLNSISAVTNSATFSGYNPFTFSNRAAANANSTVVWAANGDLVITSSAGTTCTVSCNEIQYRTLVENLKFYRVMVESIKMTFVNEPQLNNALYITKKTLLGKREENNLMPRVYFKDGQFQSKQVTIPTNMVLDGETGMYFTVNQSETAMTLTFKLSGISKWG